MKKERKYELSFMNIICCLAVIFIHINSEAALSLDKTRAAGIVAYILWQASTFVVYGFIFLSGIKQFLSKAPVFNAKAFYVKRARTIIAPYLLWVILYYIFDCAMNIESFDLRTLLYYMYSGDYAGHFYYIIVTAQFYILMPLWVRLFGRVDAAVMIPFSILFMSVFGQHLPDVVDVFVPGYYFRFADRTFTTYFAYWVMGAYIGMNYEQACRIIERNKKFIYTVFILCMAFALGCSLCDAVGNKGWKWIDTAMGMYRIAAVTALFAFSMGKCRLVCRFKSVAVLDASSYNIYLCHCLVLKETNILMDKYGISDTGVRYIIRAAAVYVISIGACMLYCAAKRRITEHIGRLKAVQKGKAKNF